MNVLSLPPSPTSAYPWPLAGELSTLLGELHKMHTKPNLQMMIQDLTPNNLLVDDSDPGGGMRLLLADPALAQPIGLLQDVFK